MSVPIWQSDRQGDTFYGFGNETVVDKVPPEMRYLVDYHWYQFPPLDPTWHKILGVAILVIGISAFLGNFLVVYIFSTTRSLRTPSNMLVMNLACSDCVMIFIQVPPTIVNCWNETWVLGPMACQIYGFIGSILGISSILTMVEIAFDRYNVIVKGLAAKPMTYKRAWLRIIITWTQSLLWTGAPLLGWNRYVPEGNMTACGTDYLSKDLASRLYILLFGMGTYIWPLSAISYCYFHIVKTVVSHEKAMRNQAKKMNVTSLRSAIEGKKISTEIKLAKVALTTIMLWFMAWTPYMIINYSGIFELITIDPLFTIWGSFFGKFGAIYNPIVYATSHPKYRAALKKKLPMFVCGSVKDVGSDGDSNITEMTITSSAEKE